MPSLPIDYSLTGLRRKPLRSALAVLSCALATLLVLGALAFSDALRASFEKIGRDDVAIVLANSAEGDPLRSEIGLGTGAEIAAEVRGIKTRDGQPLVSSEVTMGLDVVVEGDAGARPALLRGIDGAAFALHPEVTIVDGRPPGPGELIAGRLAARRLGVDPETLAPGRTVTIDGTRFMVAGGFAAASSTLEGELWADRSALMAATRRDTASCVFVALESAGDFGNLELFCRRRLDLELKAMRSSTFQAALISYFTPIRQLALGMVLLIAVAAFLTGATTLSQIVRERKVELATLRAIGWSAGAIARAILIEAFVYGAAGALLGAAAARFVVSGVSVVVAMGAVALELSSRHLVAGFLFTLLLCQIAALPALVSSLRREVAPDLRLD